MKHWLLRNWFLCGLVAVTLITTLDVNEWTVGPGRFLKDHHGPDVVIAMIFFISGFILNAAQIKTGLVDIKATLAALATIFLLAPLTAWAMGKIPMDAQIQVGLFIVAVMPSTLSSGVVMTGAAGGNMAHALVVTILANAAAVLTIPLTLGLLLAAPETARNIEIDKAAIMFKIGLLVLIPLLLGLWTSFKCGSIAASVRPKIQQVNQVLILGMVWMAISEGRDTLVGNLEALAPIAGMVFGFHLILILLSLSMAGLLGLPPGRRESVILMGGQKTLPLSLILQVSLFPEYGLALVVCMAHHIIHLIMDGFLVRRLQRSGDR